MRQAVLDATVEILVSSGIDALSIAKVAELSGVHQTSIYRRWGTPTNLAMDAVLDLLRVEVPDRDTGSLHADLFRLAHDVAGFVRTPMGLTLLRLALRTDTDLPELDQARERFWSSRVAIVDRILKHAAERGQLGPDVDAGTALEMLVGPLHMRLMLTRHPVDDDFLHGVVDLLIHGIGSEHPGP